MLKKNMILLVYTSLLFAESNEIRSIQPLYNEQTAVLDDRILGAWPGIFGDSLKFTRAGDNFYHLEIREKSKVQKFEVHLIRADTVQGGCFFVSLYPTGPSDKNYPDPTYILPLYSFYKIDLTEDVFSAKSLRYQWFKDRVLNQQLIPQYIWIPGGLLFTDATENLLNFITANDTAASMYTEHIAFSRNPTNDKTGHLNILEKLYQDEVQIDTLTNDSQNCRPVFPNKDGWLGGDGAISVPFDGQRVRLGFDSTEHARNPVGRHLLLGERSGAGRTVRRATLPEPRRRHRACVVELGWVFGTRRDGRVLIDLGHLRWHGLGVDFDARVAPVGERELMRHDAERFIDRHHDVCDRRKVLLTNRDAARRHSPRG